MTDKRSPHLPGKGPKETPKIERPDPFVREAMGVILDYLDERQSTEPQSSKGSQISPTELGTVFSIPWQHFTSCLRLLDGDRFDLRRFLELVTYLELGVLFDRLAIVADSPNMDDFGNVGGAFHTLKTELLVYLGGPDITWAGHKVLTGSQRPSMVIPGVDFEKYLGNALAERQRAMCSGFHLPLEILDQYLTTVGYEKSVESYSMLITAYDQLTGALRDELRHLEKFMRSHVLFLPPISAHILSKCSAPQEIPETFLEVRHRFADLRRHFREYEARIRDPGASIGESLRAVSRFEESLKRLAGPSQSSRMILSEWQDGLSLLPDANSLEHIEKGLLKFFLGKPLKWIIERIRSRRLLPLFDLRNKFYSIQGYPHLVERVFGVTISEQDLVESFDLNGVFQRLTPHD